MFVLWGTLSVDERERVLQPLQQLATAAAVAAASVVLFSCPFTALNEW